MLNLDHADVLGAMFAHDRDDPEWFAVFPMYGDVDDALGGPPWWPPASLVWYREGVPDSFDDPERYAVVWSRLCALYASWVAAQR
ncbi:MAG: hypothetical protein RIB46_01260 [Pseudomonadales bacterium]